MINNENQSFYIAIVGQKLHIDCFGFKDSNSGYQKNYLMPDTFGNNLNLIILSKFILEKVKDFEKDIESFIEKVYVITDAKYDQFSLSIKNKYHSDKIKETDVERLIIDAGDKNLYFMWGKIKRHCPVGDTIAWPTARAAKEAHCSKTLIAPIMKQLVSLGAVTLIQAGKAGRNSGRAAIYRREL